MTAAERERLTDLMFDGNFDHVLTEFERILADRDAALARVEALADAQTAQGWTLLTIADVLAALHPAPRETP